MFYRAELSDLDFSAGEESLAVGSTGKGHSLMNSPSLWSLTLSNAISLIGMLGSSHFERVVQPLQRPSNRADSLATEP